MSSLKIRVDEPITDKSEDRFNRNNLVDHIVKAIINYPNEKSITIGIHGKWGSGKTSVLNLIEEKLNENTGQVGNSEKLICIHFNPWIFNDVSSLVQFFFNTLADSLDRSLNSSSEKIGGLLRDYSSVISPIIRQVPIVSIFGNEELIKNFGKKLSNVESDKLKERINSILSEESKKVVIFIDDIDRLDKNEIQLIFKLVKLCADFNNITYILAFDKKLVADSLKDNYGDGEYKEGYNFLEKIIQFPIELPSINELDFRIFFGDEVESVIQDHNITLSNVEIQRFWIAYNEAIGKSFKNPRQVTLYCNSLTFSLSALKDEVNVLDLLFIESIKVLYPVLFQAIRDNPNFFLLPVDIFDRSDDTIVTEKCKEIIESSFDETTQNQIENAKYLIKELFPRVNKIDQNIIYDYHWDSSWYKEKKLASKEYFYKYFNYSIQKGLLSDADYLIIIDMITNADKIEDAQNKIKDIFLDNFGNSFIEKTRHNKEHFTPDQLIKIIRGVALSGDTFTNNKRFFGLSDFENASLEIIRLVQILPNNNERYEISKWIIHNAIPLPFAVEYYRWLNVDFDPEPEKEGGKETTITKNQFDEIGILLSKRIKDHLEKSEDPVFIEFPENYLIILIYWAAISGKEETNKYLSSIFINDPKTAIQFLNGYRPVSTDMVSGIRKKEGLLFESLKGIFNLVDQSIIKKAILSIYGEKDLESSINNYEKDENFLIAQQFIRLLKKYEVDKLGLDD